MCKRQIINKPSYISYLLGPTDELSVVSLLTNEPVVVMFCAAVEVDIDVPMVHIHVHCI